MVQAKNAAFKFKGFRIPSFSYDESGKSGPALILNFVPNGRYSQKDGVFELTLEMYGNEPEDKKKQIIYLKLLSFFEFEKGLPIEEIPSYFYKNAIAIVFPYIRSFASTLTLQANCRLLILGLMNLSNLEAPLIKNTISE
jgi:preprotein translocase subunit SecB